MKRCMNSAMMRQAPVPESDWMAATLPSVMAALSSPSASFTALLMNGL